MDYKKLKYFLPVCFILYIPLYIFIMLENHSFVERRFYNGASQVVQWVKNQPAMQETEEMHFQSLGREDPLEEGLATHTNILAWRVPWTEEPGGL